MHLKIDVSSKSVVNQKQSPANTGKSCS